MRLSATLSGYVARQFARWFGIVVAGALLIVLLADTIELLRRAADKEQASFGIILEMALLKLPHMIQVLIPFTILFAGMLAWWKLARTRELVVARAAGISVWHLLLPVLLVAFLIGAVRIVVLGPFAAAALARYENLENLYLETDGSRLSISDSGVWLRQFDSTGQSLIHAGRVDATSHRLFDLVFFRFDGDGRFISRIDADRALLESGEWHISDALTSTRRAKPEKSEVVRIETDLTWEEIQDSFASPETMSIWELANFISTMEKAGFPAVRHRLHFQAQLASPLLLCAMVLIAAAFSLRADQRSRSTHLVIAGIAIGFGFHVASDLVSALGLSGRIPAELAAWAPTSVCLMLGITTLFHLEDG